VLASVDDDVARRRREAHQEQPPHSRLGGEGRMDGWMGKEREKETSSCPVASVVSCLITSPPKPHAFSRRFLWLVKPARGRDVTDH
jgi:hypothetical protein